MFYSVYLIFQAWVILQPCSCNIFDHVLGPVNTNGLQL